MEEKVVGGVESAGTPVDAPGMDIALRDQAQKSLGKALR